MKTQNKHTFVYFPSTRRIFVILCKSLHFVKAPLKLRALLLYRQTEYSQTDWLSQKKVPNLQP